MTDLQYPHASPQARVVPTPPGFADPAQDPETAQAAIDSLLSGADELMVATPDSTRFELPTGLMWEGRLLRNVEIRELTGNDEEMLARESKGKEFFVGPHFMDLILRDTVVRLEDQKPTASMLGQLLLGDRAFLGLAIRRLTYGDWWEVEDFICRLCGKKFGIAIDLRCPSDDIKMKTLSNPREQFVEVSTKKGLAHVRLVNGDDELVSLGDGTLTHAERTTLFIDRCTLSVNGEHPPAGFAKNLGAADRRKIMTALGDNAPGPLLGEVSVPCSACGRSAEYQLNVADLFLR